MLSSFTESPCDAHHLYGVHVEQSHLSGGIAMAKNIHEIVTGKTAEKQTKMENQNVEYVVINLQFSKNFKLDRKILNFLTLALPFTALISCQNLETTQ